MKMLSLFSGCGLGDLGWLMAGFEIVAQVEIDDYCQKILELRFPETEKYRDIKKFKGCEAKPVDIVAGGFPCQPFSVAGKQRGDQDDRNLWPQMFRIIKEIGPTWVVGENVSGILNIYLDNVLSDLESEGYSCRTFVFPAHALGASHRRERIWIVGYSEHNGQLAREKLRCDETTSNNRWKKKQKETGEFEGTNKPVDVSSIQRCKQGGESSEAMADASNTRIEGMCGRTKQADKAMADAGQQHGERNTKGMEANKTKRGASIISSESGCERQATTNTDTKRREGTKNAGNIKEGGAHQNKQFAGCDSIRNYWATEPSICRVVNGCSSRVDRLKALGNGQVVACTAFIGQLIMEVERLNGIPNS